MSLQNTLNGAARDSSLWFPGLQPRQNPWLRLICFPYAGAGIPAFRAWPAGLPEGIELRVAQLPGRGIRFREDRFEQMPPLVEILTEALLPLLDRPFAFFGHSLGAIIAFEVARKLRGRGLTPQHLFASGHIAPQLPNPEPRICELPDEAFLREIQSLNGMPQAVLESKELLEIVLPAVRSDFTLLENYQYQPGEPLGCAITACGGLKDPRVSRSGMEGWGAQTKAAFDLVMFQGDHFFLEPERPLLLDILTRRLFDNTPGHRDTRPTL